MTLQIKLRSFQMDYIKDVIYVNKESFSKTIKSLKKSWPIIFIGLVYGLISIVVSGVLNLLLMGPLGILSGIISIIITSSLFSNYLYLLSNVIKFGRVDFDDFKNGFTFYLRKIYSVIFIFYLANLLITLTTNMLGSLGLTLTTLISLAAFILLNALPETIYQKYYGPVDTISYTFSFFTENVLNWAIPNIVFFAILYSLLPNIFSLSLILSYRVMPGVGTILGFLIGQLVFNFGMIYRGHLFDLLSTSTKRKREYIKKF